MHVAIADAGGRTIEAAGDPALVAFARSAVKPVQALPLIQDGAADRLGMTAQELALCCASHNGEPGHVALARSILARAGLEEDALACGPHMPFDEDAAGAILAAGGKPGRLHNNCSGKHAGLLVVAVQNGWPTVGYHELRHPMQQRILGDIAEWGGLARSGIETGVDGCGIPTFALPLDAMARMFALLAFRSTAGDSAPGRVVGAMVSHPWAVAGRNRLCTALMEATQGRVFAKVGAEGVYCAGVPAAGLGIALKVEDGAVRAAETALLAVLHQLGALDASAMTLLTRWSRPEIRNTRDEVVGRIDVSMHMGGVAA